MQRVKFYTVGCKVNQYETQSIREQFIRFGFKAIDNGGSADIYLINTCTVTQKADRDSRHLIHLTHRQNPQAKILVTGCYTELDSAEIAKIPGVTHIIKNKDKDRIIELFSQRNNESTKQRVNEHIGITNFSGHTRAFLKIHDGCNNFCAYCKVPLVRGASRSRPLSSIVQEAGQLVKNGFKEIVLCGICLGDYGKDLASPLNLVDVIEALEETEGLLRIRLSSIEAGNISDKLIEKIKESKKLCPHLHIPVQSGDNEILRKMNRSYGREAYVDLIKKIKNKIPQIAISTDVLVGFPGEREENFQNTVKLIQEIAPLKVHIFSYSKRIGTCASNFKDEVELHIIKERVQRLLAIAEGCSLAYRKKFLNKRLDVLIESRSKENPGFWEGHADNYIKVLVISKKNLKNQLISLRLKKTVKGFIHADFS